MALTSKEPFPARLMKVGGKTDDYSIVEAVAAFKRVAALHNWTIPEGIDDIASMQKKSEA